MWKRGGEGKNTGDILTKKSFSHSLWSGDGERTRFGAGKAQHVPAVPREKLLEARPRFSARARRPVPVPPAAPGADSA